MSRSVGFLSVCLALVVGSPAVAIADGACIVVEVEGLRSGRGSVRGALFASSRGWAEEGRELATCEARIVGGRSVCMFEDVAPGEYALAFLHDEDDDGALDRDFIGWPQEGFGFSNDARPGLGPPSYESAAFEHGAGATTLTVHARYGL
jgi:uncharacterized protein (DUF2141 family)